MPSLKSIICLNYLGGDYVLKVGKTKQLPKKSGVKWSSDNKKVATVTQTGKVKAKSGGTAVITATTSSGYKCEYEIGVQSRKYYPNIDEKMKVGKDIPAGQYVLIRDTKCSMYCLTSLECPKCHKKPDLNADGLFPLDAEYLFFGLSCLKLEQTGIQL